MNCLRCWLLRCLHVIRFTARVVFSPVVIVASKLRRIGRRKLIRTAYSLSTSRALESLRKDALFHDPLAKHFSRPLPGKDVESVCSEALNGHRKVSYTITRTKFFDDALLTVLKPRSEINPLFADLRAVASSCERCEWEQVAILGAGFDSRPWRLPISAVRWFEVDFPALMNDKIKILNEAGASLSFAKNAQSRYPLQCFEHHFVPGDISEPKWIKQMLNLGLDKTVATTWVLEGLLTHLEPQAVARVLETMSNNSAPGSLLMLSMVTEKYIENMDASSKLGRKWGCPQNAEEFFMNFGWSIVSLLPWTMVAELYGCQPRRRSKSNDPAQYLIAVKA